MITGRAFGAGAMALALSACVATTPVSAPAPVRPASPVQTPVIAAPASPRISAEKAALIAYYADVQRDLLANDLMRTDMGGPDTPFGARQLAQNFEAIALNDEYANVGGTFVARTTPSNLHRWDVPVRIGLVFGASVPEATRAEDRATVSRLASRLAGATGHPISVGGPANFTVFVVDEAERRQLGPQIARLIPGIAPAALRSVEQMPRSSYCLVIASDPRNNGAYRNAVAVVRAEHPSLMRRSCFHEEIAQGLGLANDSPLARPSIFNDDEEFALLTRHDELLLRILYDRRLRPGMTPQEAAPIAAAIAREVMGERL